MKTPAFTAAPPANEMIEFQFASFLRDLDRWKARNAAHELNRRLVRQMTREQMARAC